MAIPLSRDAEIVKYINSIPRTEFREKLLNGVAKDLSFSVVLDDPYATEDDYKILHDLMIEKGIPERLISTDQGIREAAQMIMNRIMSAL